MANNRKMTKGRKSSLMNQGWNGDHDSKQSEKRFPGHKSFRRHQKKMRKFARAFELQNQ
jgi:hypothetical protein